MNIIDISPPLTPESALFPGEAKLRREIQCSLEKGDVITLSSLHSSVHVGAHADAPSHTVKGTATIDQVDLNTYLGECFVLNCEKASLITEKVAEKAIGKSKRILFRTLTHKPNEFEKHFCTFDPSAIELLGKNGVILVGIDTPSLDIPSSKDLPAHKKLVSCGMRNLENLVLDHVAEGIYELIALPLKLVGFDASPVRAILVEK